ncbi:hypothetical protein SBOR_4089 [Sclerotinia borealis F-4128]|uniref:Uncharacterized protein n=1 Tax=Sclerotinia borealis (strain F-4128) TaxID=1432307 RepID=W9CI41_SCLBF|nr:hypothetical protein SBOR_4089 [Sclerotinia borealis F-4128]
MDSFQDLADMTLDVESKPERRVTNVTTQPQTFVYFVLLPGELPTDGRLRFRNYDHLGTTPIPRGLLPVKNTRWTPSILLVNKDSRRIGLRYYKNISLDPVYSPIYYNQALDSISVLGPLHVTFPLVYRINADLVTRVHIPTRVVYMTASMGRSNHRFPTPQWNWAKVMNQNIIQYLMVGDFNLSHLPFGTSTTRTQPWELVIEDLPCRNPHEIEDIQSQQQWRYLIITELARQAASEVFVFPIIVFKLAAKSTNVCADCRAFKTRETKMKNPRKKKNLITQVGGSSTK